MLFLALFVSWDLDDRQLPDRFGYYLQAYAGWPPIPMKWPAPGPMDEAVHAVSANLLYAFGQVIL